MINTKSSLFTFSIKCFELELNGKWTNDGIYFRKPEKNSEPKHLESPQISTKLKLVCAPQFMAVCMAVCMTLDLHWILYDDNDVATWFANIFGHTKLEKKENTIAMTYFVGQMVDYSVSSRRDKVRHSHTKRTDDWIIFDFRTFGRFYFGPSDYCIAETSTDSVDLLSKSSDNRLRFFSYSALCFSGHSRNESIFNCIW